MLPAQTPAHANKPAHPPRPLLPHPQALFANFFASACSALDEHAKARAAAGEALETPWWSAATGHIVNIGRRHLSEFSLAAIEAVAEAEELSEPVNEAIFKPLQQLVAWQL
jgi:hypothetical protein